MQTVTVPSPAWPPSTSDSPALTSSSPITSSTSSSSQDPTPQTWLPKPEYTTNSIARQLLAEIDSRAQSEDGPAWFLKYHTSLGRIYAYYSTLGGEGEPLCASLESMACAATDELFRPKRAAMKQEGRVVSETTTAWALCEKFGPGPRAKVLSAVRAKVEELLIHGKSQASSPEIL
jgi:hypothetical protein